MLVVEISVSIFYDKIRIIPLLRIVKYFSNETNKTIGVCVSYEFLFTSSGSSVGLPIMKTPFGLSSLRGVELMFQIWLTHYYLYHFSNHVRLTSVRLQVDFIPFLLLSLSNSLFSLTYICSTLEPLNPSNIFLN